jgi:O-antigen ligase
MHAIDRQLLEYYEPTNVLTELLGSLGLFGFLAFALFIAALFRFFRKILADRRLYAQERIHLLSFFISIIVMLICLQINQGLFRAYIWVHLGMGAGYAMKIHEMLKRRL